VGARRVLVVVLLAVACGVGACSTGADPARPSSSSSSSSSSMSAPTSAVVTDRTGPSSSDPTGPPRTSAPPSRPAVRTPQGLWWGVDSTRPITTAALRNVHDWYRGARPQVWGRYVDGDYAVTRAELARARAAGVYVYLIVTDRNGSGCSGGDVCGNDRTRAQAASDAAAAVGDARRLGLPSGALLFKDIEEVAGCSGGVTPDYLRGWYAAARAAGYRVGFYGNVHRQFFAFPRAYCAARKADATFAAGVVLDMNEDEPMIGAPRGATGPDNAPRFTPNSPSCAPPAATVVWQYGESLDDGNWTDVDQARPDTAGLLAPDGGVTGGVTG
jgi:hypothetical protein